MSLMLRTIRDMIGKTALLRELEKRQTYYQGHEKQ